MRKTVIGKSPRIIRTDKAIGTKQWGSFEVKLARIIIRLRIVRRRERSGSYFVGAVFQGQTSHVERQLKREIFKLLN